jgi:4-amino-4-deoxy-L-arabinose transferase-like glycosyltransferase
MLAVFAWLAVTAGVRPLALPDEGRYVGVAFEMLWSGDWLVPTLDTLPYFHKPPLFYWLTGASLAVFRINDWAARLPSLLAATATVFAVYLFVGRWANQTQARLTLVVLVTTPFFFGGAQFANLDMLVTACIAFTVLCAADAVLAGHGGRPRPGALAAAYASAALGVLAKGLIGAVIPALVVAAWLVLTGRRGMILRLVWLPGIALFAAIAAPWFVLVEARHPGFLSYFFIHHHLERFTTQQFNGHHPFWFYLPVFAGLTLPWLIVLIDAARQGAVGSDARQIGLLMWIWLTATLVFFSIPASKLVGYVLIAVPPFAVLTGGALDRLVGSAHGGRRAGPMIATAVAILVCLASVFVARRYQNDSVQELAAHIRATTGATNSELVAVRSYPFSLPFYLQRGQPMRLVEDWDDERTLQKDTWRRELSDAARFDPAKARLVLLKPADLRRLLACSERSVWVIAPPDETARSPELAHLERIAVVGPHVLWRRSATRTTSEGPDCGP